MWLDSVIVGAAVVSAAAYLVWHFVPRRRPSPCAACPSRDRHAVPVKVRGTP
jgi:hypothetical protein